MAALIASLTDSPHAFLQPSLPLYTDTLAYLKHALDPLAADVSRVQQQRQHNARKKRKRGEAVSDHDVLRLTRIHTAGFGPEQVWEQARRVIDAARAEAARGLREAQSRHDGSAADAEDEEDESALGEEGRDYEVEGVDDDEDAVYDGTDDDGDGDGDLDAALDAAERGGQDDYAEDDDIDMDGEGLGDDEPAEELVNDKFGLNDGFFSIDNFNKQSEFLEQQDARGDDDGAASDEEDVDWDADPLAGARAVNGKAAPAVAKMEDEDDEDDGPTFGDPDAESEDEEEAVDGGELDGMGDMGLGNTNNVMYADFFAPPAQKKKQNKKGRPNPHNFPESARNAKTDQEDGGDIERVADAVHRDLFDESEEEEDDEAAEGVKLDPSDPRSRRSTHERRKAALQEEIRKLEAANVAKREWTLSGEARAADRPLNSLLEEDLEFERTGKPVPVITAEVSESIEELIKRRILNHDFQDIIRRRPDDLATGKDSRRGKLDFELDNNKSQKGLAEEYEEEHLRRTDPNFVDVKDEKLKKEEAEISALWSKIRSDLDSLSSWHFRPKAPAPQLEVRVDAPTIMMEDARPSAGNAVAGASQLAPQEVYKGGEANKGVNEEVAGKSGLPAAREELSREEKKRRRRREKERIHKANGNAPPPGTNKSGAGGKKGKHKVLSDLKKGGVKVIGKKGKVTDVEGKEAKAGTGGGQNGAGRYKL
ncbi:Mpp10 protein [Teratosphaeria nubilosa]|uniref:U3 small nucleolar ribonucleoprotein protein MPP10 n=1 Tax=Teratosphaeria nubilosa TaxID=161662 RepID=A0A6G1L0Q5_9PEZI|nr:Mpp10 protein [Teratosphaeria nubilosa]